MLKNAWKELKDRFTNHPISSIIGVVSGVSLIVGSGGSLLPIMGGIILILGGSVVKDK